MLLVLPTTLLNVVGELGPGAGGGGGGPGGGLSSSGRGGQGTKVGAANLESGVSHLLAEQEGLSRRIALMKSILAKPSNAISLDALPDYKPFGEQNSFARVTGIQVSTLPTEISNDLAIELTKLQTQAFALSDKMADANASRISLELPDNIAEVLGLV